MTTKYLFLKNTQLVSLNSLLFICNTFCKASKLSVSSDAVFRWNTFQWNFRDVLRKIWSFPSKWVDAHPQICEPVVTSTHIISRHKLRSRNKARAILQNWDSNKVRVETMDKLRGARHQNFTERFDGPTALCSQTFAQWDAVEVASLNRVLSWFVAPLPWKVIDFTCKLIETCLLYFNNSPGVFALSPNPSSIAMVRPHLHRA